MRQFVFDVSVLLSGALLALLVATWSWDLRASFLWNAGAVSRIALDASGEGVRLTRGTRPVMGIPIPKFDVGGFYFENHKLLPIAQPLRYTELRIPAWFFLLCALPLLVVWVKRMMWHESALTPICPRCGYDLRASEEQCPECGTAFPRVYEAPLVQPHREPWCRSRAAAKWRRMHSA